MNTFADRLRYAMSIKNMKQAELVELTGIGKSSISQYLSGQYVPKNKNLYLISKALNVNEDWLLGNSDSIDRKSFYFSPDSELIKIFKKISSDEDISLDLLIDAFCFNTNYLKITPTKGREVLNYDNILHNVKNSLKNKFSEEALEVAEAYDTADNKTKNIVRLALDLPDTNNYRKDV